jgi:LGFP repeat
MTIELRASVGDGGQVNHKEDVALVQFLLNATNPPVAMDGLWGPIVSAAVAAFQTTTFGFTDGRVDPGDITFNRLRGNDINTTTDPVGDTVRRLVVLDALGIVALPAPPPVATRPTSDGFGTVVTWPEGAGILEVFSHSTFGTWEVRGVILARYLAIGEESSALGNPISGERDAPSGGGDRVSYFEHGRILFTAATGAAAEIFS